MTEATRLTPSEIAERLSVRGLVQGVGFRPTVWCLAQQHNIRGSVTNNGDGVEIHACGSANNLAQFINALTREAPPLARVDGIVRRVAELVPAAAGFQIAASVTTSVHTGVVPDTATCAACLAEILLRWRVTSVIRSRTARIAGRAFRSFRAFRTTASKRRQ